MNPFLRPTAIINWDHPEVLALASYLSKGSQEPLELIRRSFEWVRDQIAHSWDYQKSAVPLKASEVLINKNGCCFAKSHLLSALLRANGIPSGFCYQRVDNDWGPKSKRLHGLNAVYLSQTGWLRVDARGGKTSAKTFFMPPVESLTYENAEHILGIWPNPLDSVVDALLNSSHVNELYHRLPDQMMISYSTTSSEEDYFIDQLSSTTSENDHGNDKSSRAA